MNEITDDDLLTDLWIEMKYRLIKMFIVLL